MFVTQSGRRFVLAHYSLAEWAAMRMSDMLRLGCSDQYAEKVYREYADAERLS